MERCLFVSEKQLLVNKLHHHKVCI